MFVGNPASRNAPDRLGRGDQPAWYWWNLRKGQADTECAILQPPGLTGKLGEFDRGLGAAQEGEDLLADLVRDNGAPEQTGISFLLDVHRSSFRSCIKKQMWTRCG